MDGWLSYFEELLWWIPWRDPLGRSRAHDRQSELRMRVALETQLRRREDIAAREPYRA